MTEQEEDVVEDGNRVNTLQALQQHKICKSALMELMSVQDKWWGTCWNHLKPGTATAQGLKGQPSNRKQRFRDEEEAHLIRFFVEITEFAEPSATRFVLEETEENGHAMMILSWSIYHPVGLDENYTKDMHADLVGMLQQRTLELSN
jgi:hypothetical protein